MIDLRRHVLSVRVPQQPLVVNGDPARLTQIVANLLNNAAKYQDEGGRIELAVDADRLDVVLTVKDAGIGIAPEMLPLVFDLFSQVAASRHRSDDGLGIGLALVKKLTELHGGTIEAKSGGLQRGSEFVVRIPRLAGTEQSKGVGAAGTAATSFGGPPVRILVVDDNRDAADSLATLLRLGGHHVSVAEVVFLDLGMPGMDGYEVCRRARALGLSDTQIIAVSGYGQARDLRQCEDAGFDGHSVKPIELAEVLRLLARRSTRRV
jgi:hypothetical protein